MHIDMYVRLSPDRWSEVVQALEKKNAELDRPDCVEETFYERADARGALSQARHGSEGKPVTPTQWGERALSSLSGFEDVKEAYRVALDKWTDGS